MMKKIYFLLLAALAVSVSCQRERFGENAPSDPDVVRLSFSVLPNTDGPFTRSSISSDTDKLDTTVNDMNIWIYRDGLLYRQIYRTTTADTTMRLDSSTAHTYHIFALANVGKRTPQIHSADLRTFDKFYLDSITVDYMTEHGLPMAYEADLTFGTSTHQVLLKRYVARYDFKIDRSHLIGKFEVTSVALCQSRNGFNPFYTGKQFATEASHVEKGDTSSAQDVTDLNSDKSVVYYALHNEQGDLCPYNTNPWQKIPDSVVLDYRNLCVYIHLKGKYIDGPLTRNMEYKFYLGKDAVKNFTIDANTRYTVTFFPCDSTTTKKGNWKITGTDEGRDDRKINIGTLTSTDTLAITAGKDTTLTFTADCAVDTLMKFTNKGFSYKFIKKPAFNDDATDSLKISVADTVTANTIDSLIFGTFDRALKCPLRIKVLPAPSPSGPDYPGAPDSLKAVKMKGAGSDSIWWAPVNCGYDESHKYGLLYQFGRKVGSTYGPEGARKKFEELGYQTGVEFEYSSDDCNKNPNDGEFYHNYGGTKLPMADWYTCESTKQLSEWPMTDPSGTTGIGNPCPPGWRVPTSAELDTLCQTQSSWTQQGNISGNLYAGKLFLPAAGCRSEDEGTASQRSKGGFYWSSSVESTYAIRLSFSEEAGGLDGRYRASGFSVRCVHDVK